MRGRTRRLLVATLTPLLLALGVAGATSASAAPRQADGQQYRPGVLVVGYKSGTTDASKDGQKSRPRPRREKRLNAINVDVVDLPPGTDVQAAAAQFRGDTEVAYAEPDYVAKVDAF